MLLLKENVEEMVRERVALRWGREELGDNTKRLFGKLDRSKATKVPVTAKQHDLEAQLTLGDTGRAVARGALEEGVTRLVALGRELREEVIQLARQRR